MPEPGPLQIGQNLSAVREELRPGARVRLSGVIDENVDADLLARVLDGVAVIDLDEVRRITSYGVRSWFTALGKHAPDYYCFVRCRPALVAQFNMVSAFGGAGELVSFYLPYVCPKCGSSLELLVDVREAHERLAALELPPLQCPDCGVAAEFDDLPDTYLGYISTRPKPAPPPTVALLIDGSPQALAAPQPLRVKTELEVSFTAVWMSGDLDGRAPLKRLGETLQGQVLLVASEIASANAEGAARLTAVTGSSQFDLFIARLPLDVADVLVRTQALGQARLWSLNVPLACPKCGSTLHAELDLNAWLDAREPQRSCPRCGSQAKRRYDLGQVEALGPLPWCPLPEPMISYLATHAALPKPAGLAPGLSADTPSRASLPVEPAPQERAFGKYELLERIGVGGMAEVFLARLAGPQGFEKAVVLKRILPHLSRDEKFVQLFLQEARIAARISHSNVVQIFELGQQDEQYFIAMEYVQGWDLRQVLRMLRKIGEKMPLHYACKVVMDACAGLEAAHGCVAPGNDVSGVVHRDMSPSNILIGVDGVVKVTDFGIAKSANSGHTATSLVKGKLPYLAPEAFGAAPRTDRRMDIFALGAVLSECITGVRLFQRESEAATLEALLRGPVPRMSDRRDGLPEKLEEVLKRAVAKDPDERYQTARAMLEDLEAVVEAAHLRASTTGFVTWLKQIDRTAKLGPPASPPRGVVAAGALLSSPGGPPNKDEPPHR